MLPDEAERKQIFPQILVSVSRKHFRRAHDRNLIKRRCREIYRLYKNDLLTRKKKLPALLGIIYVGKKHESFDFMRQQLQRLLDRLPEAAADTAPCNDE